MKVRDAKFFGKIKIFVEVQSEFGATNSVISNAELMAKIEISAKINFCNKLVSPRSVKCLKHFSQQFNDSINENKTSIAATIAAFICEKAICEMKATGNEQKHERNLAIFHKRLVRIYKSVNWRI